MLRDKKSKRDANFLEKEQKTIKNVYNQWFSDIYFSRKQNIMRKWQLNATKIAKLSKNRQPCFGESLTHLYESQITRRKVNIYRQKLSLSRIPVVGQSEVPHHLGFAECVPRCLCQLRSPQTFWKIRQLGMLAMLEFSLKLC